MTVNFIKRNIWPVNGLHYIFLFSILCALAIFRVTQIWTNSVDDFDTSSLILQISNFKIGSNPHFFWVDIAHPGMLSVWIFLAHSIHGLTECPPIYIWNTLITAGLIVACISLYFLSNKLSTSKFIAFSSVVLYLASPAISDIASRSEENFLYHAMFIAAIYIITSYINNKNHALMPIIFIFSLILSAQHLQPFLILCGGIFLFYISELLKLKNRINSDHKYAGYAFIAFLTPGLIYYLIIHKIFYDPSLVRSYSANFYSLLNNDSILKYLKAFLLFAQGYVLSGSMPVDSWAAISIEPRSHIYLLGLIVIFISFYLLRKRRLINFITLSALGFVFLYEPSASERWDTFVITLIISLSYVFNDALIDQNGFQSRAFFITSFLIAFLLIFNFFSIPNQIATLKNSLNVHNDVDNALFKKQTIYTDIESGRIILSQLPRKLQIKNVDFSMLKPGDAVYLLNAPNIIRTKFKIECTPSVIPDFCFITSPL